jgi:hypothetical protein
MRGLDVISAIFDKQLMNATLVPPVSDPKRQATPQARRFALIALAVVAALGAIWSGLWYYLASQTEAAIIEAIVREAKFGHEFSCESRHISGFPFRLEARCDKAKLEIAGAQGATSVTLPSLSGVGRIGDPGRVLIEAKGPLSIERPGQPPAAIDWRSLQANVLPTQKDILVEAPTLQVGDGQNRIAATADRLAIRLRPDPNDAPHDDAAEVTASLSRLTSAIADSVTGNTAPIDLAVTLSVSQASMLQGRDEKSAPPPLEQWRLAGGRLRIAQANASKGALGANLSGEVALDDAHRVAGRVDVALEGADTLLSKLGVPPSVLGLLSLGGGKLRLPLAMKDGKATVGPFMVARLLALY